MLVLSLVSVCFAADGVTVSVSSGSVTAGESVTLALSISDVAPLAAFKAEIEWDASAFTLGKVTDGAALFGGTVVKNENLPGKLLIAMGSAQNINASGDVVLFELIAKKEARNGEYPITLTVSSFSDEEGNKGSPTVISGNVTLTGGTDAPPAVEEDKENDGDENSGGTSGGSTSGGTSGGGSGGGGGGGFVPAIPKPENPQTSVTDTEDKGTTEAEKENSPEKENPFFDVAEFDFYYDAVLWAVKNGITSGVSGVSFAPSSPCTRAQTVTFLWRAAGSPEPVNSKNPFSDVAENAYYFKAVLWAAEQGITSGTSPDKFSPDKTVSRAETVTFLYRAAKADAQTEKNPFSDVSDGAYYYAPVLWAVKNGITNGVSETAFAPTASCTRAQIVTFMYRATEK